MAALTKDRATSKKMIFGEKAYPVKDATKIFAGSIVGVQVDSHAVPASDAASVRVVGVAKEQVDNSAGADGDLLVKVEKGLFLFDATSITQAMVGRVMYTVDDHTFDEALGTNGIKCGRLLEFVSTTSGWIWVEECGAGVVDADADATYSANEQTLINALKTAVNERIL